MCSLVTSKIGYYWKNNDSIKLGGCFKIEWITTAFLSYSRVQNFINPLNNNEPVRKSRDTQELPSNIGKEICLMFQIPKIKEDPNTINDNDSASSDDYFEAKRAKKEL
jgi:YT521-B-like domain